MRKAFSSSRPTLLRAAGSLLSALLLGFLLAVNWGEVQTALRQIALHHFLIAFGLVFVSRLFTVLRWYILLRSGGVPISLAETVSLTFTGLFASNFLPTTIGGDVVRLAGAIQRGYDRAVCLASIAADRLVNMAGMSLTAPLGLYQIWLAAPPAASAVLSAGMVASPFHTIRQKTWHFLRRTLESLAFWLQKPGFLFLALLAGLANMLCLFGANYVLLRALGADLAAWRVIGIYSLAYFVGLIPISINGYGWQELTSSALLAGLGGVVPSLGAAVAVFNRLLMMIASLPGAFTLPGVLARLPKDEQP
ncbi:MAG: flippase-like domain-containing protein [Anaerolineales bacterium]|nr:flippase-like domain-containing protein [Anaerolineales bacterium]MCX7756646.1 flippase-like domain-containing protein [Anaerolineales bacterium]MDW8277279.1 lysylphosphatidylglycerol synthase transmembrane domain-containing protein [Anaerolineales bacterium]